MNQKDYSGVLVFAEQRSGEIQNVSLELLGKGRKIADELGASLMAVLPGKDMKKHSRLLIEYGADQVVLIEDDSLGI